MNRIILIGRLTKDPELRHTESNIAVASFSVAVQQAYANQQGERGVDFFNCIAWRKQAENLSRYCKKGDQIAIEGRLQNRSYNDKEGNKKYVTEIVADNITFLGSKSNSEGQATSKQETDTTDISEDPFLSFANETQISSDELPF